DWVADIVRENQPSPVEFSVVSCPEFLREGSAIVDFLSPDRTILGSEDMGAAERVAQLHLPLRAPIMVTDLRTAEMIKYASNAFLATRISFINEIANICEELGADVKEVARGMGYDKRIGHHFLEAGIGYGGSCFPKDVKALAHMAQVHGRHPQLLQAVMDINDFQRRHVLLKLHEMLDHLKGRTIALLGLAFKQNTDDMREAPSLTIAEYCHDHGAAVRGYDPAAMDVAQRMMPFMEMAANPYELVKGADAVVVMTPWNEFKNLDMTRIRNVMQTPMMVDGRNMYEPDEMRALGFTYRGIGRGYSGNPNPEA
ncbi:MAG: UDP-glucose/GDP-mannose dehydrogenase family protein, partial [Anaerolineae bacterium]|nr:UDP-glucose/GDP-mannose dehydrogenase family protein [Anaerolineae bacterium]